MMEPKPPRGKKSNSAVIAELDLIVAEAKRVATCHKAGAALGYVGTDGGWYFGAGEPMRIDPTNREGTL